MSRTLLKRPAGFLFTAAKRPALEDPIVSKCQQVADALEKADDVPPTARKMLQGMAVAALSVPVEERHPFQVTVVDMMGEAFKSMEERLAATVTELQTKVEGCPQDKVAREAALVAAQEKLVGLKEACKHAALEVEQAALDVARGELAAAQKVQRLGDARLQEAVERLEKLEGGRDLVLEAKNPEQVVAFCEEVDFDRALVQALPLVLKKEPESRFGFDLVVLELLEAEFKEALEKQQTQVQEGAPAKEQRAEAVAAASAAFDQAQARTDAADAAHTAAGQALRDGEAALTAAQAAVSQFFPETKALMDSYDERKAQLAEMRAGFLATFQELKVRSAAAPPSDPVAEAADSAEAADGAEAAAGAEPAEGAEPAVSGEPAAPEEPAGSAPAGAAD